MALPARPRQGQRRGYTAALLLVLLPVLALASYVLVLRGWSQCWRPALLGGAVIWGTALVAMTEILSAFHELTASWLAITWLIALVPSVGVLVRTRPWRTWNRPTVTFTRQQVVFIAPLVAMLLVLGVVAVLCPPNTWDSMTYHMARLIHWQQDTSLAPYPTHILRQLYLQPGAEFVLLHLQLLSGLDRFAGLVQWASMLGALVGVSLIAQQLDAGIPGALLATVFAASIPIGVLESTSTQNDYVVAFWLVCLTVFGLRLMRVESSHVAWTDAGFVGMSLGLALVTKATAYLVAFPLLVWLSVVVVRRFRARAIGILAMVAAIALLLNTGYFIRNIAIFNSPTGPPDEGAPSVRYLNDTLTPGLFASNVLRDAGLNLVATPVAAVNVRAFNLVRALHGWIGVDMADPRTTWGNEVFSEQSAGLAFDENRASNPVHLMLLLAAFVGIWPLWRKIRPDARWYALSLACGVLLFAAVLRWQPWHTRLELPLFVLGAPLVGLVAERAASRLATTLSVLLLIGMVPWVVYNQARPVVGPRSILLVDRDDQYFTNRPGVRAAYEGATQFLADRHCAQIGFFSDQDGWEYPLRALVPGAIEIEHVAIANTSAGTAGASPGFEPCGVLAFGTAGAGLESINLGGQTYVKNWTAGDGVDSVGVLTADSH